MFKTQSPESALPKELLGPGLAGQRGPGGGVEVGGHGGYIVAVGPDDS